MANVPRQADGDFHFGLDCLGLLGLIHCLLWKWQVTGSRVGAHLLQGGTPTPSTLARTRITLALSSPHRCWVSLGTLARAFQAKWVGEMKRDRGRSVFGQGSQKPDGRHPFNSIHYPSKRLGLQSSRCWPENALLRPGQPRWVPRTGQLPLSNGPVHRILP